VQALSQWDFDAGKSRMSTVLGPRACVSCQCRFEKDRVYVLGRPPSVQVKPMKVLRTST
jgi:hypothetical protein